MNKKMIIALVFCLQVLVSLGMMAQQTMVCQRR